MRTVSSDSAGGGDRVVWAGDLQDQTRRAVDQHNISVGAQSSSPDPKIHTDNVAMPGMRVRGGIDLFIFIFFFALPSSYHLKYPSLGSLQRHSDARLQLNY